MKPYFPPFTTTNKTYPLNHLDPLPFVVAVGERYIVIKAFYSDHCFTEKLSDVKTTNNLNALSIETRTFDVTRYRLSLLLPTLVSGISNSTVYKTRKGTYFFWKHNPLYGITEPYLVFFSVSKAKDNYIDVIMNIESAYLKPNMAERASPVRFGTLIEKTLSRETVPVGPEVLIKKR